MAELYKLLGVLTVPMEKLPKIAGIHTYLDFIVEGEEGLPLEVTTEPSPRALTEDITPMPQLHPESYHHARLLMRSPLYESVFDGVRIDLETQVVCQDREGIYMANAEKLHRYRITLRDSLRKEIRRSIDS